MSRCDSRYDWDWEDEEDSAHGDGVTCKFCDAGPFEWARIRDANDEIVWALVDEEGNVHACKRTADPKTEFEDLDAPRSVRQRSCTKKT